MIFQRPFVNFSAAFIVKVHQDVSEKLKALRSVSYSTRICLFGQIAGSDHILILENVQVENSGIYTCDLANVLGHVSAQVHLIVAETKDYLSAGSGEASNFHQINFIEFLCESKEQKNRADCSETGMERGNF